MRNLGKAVGILARAEAAEHDYHADVDAWGAPGECHAVVAKGAARRLRRARKHAEAVAGMPLRAIARHALRRGCVVLHSGQPRWQGTVARLLTHPHLIGGRP
jgi:hypothetical protein